MICPNMAKYLLFVSKLTSNYYYSLKYYSVGVRVKNKEDFICEGLYFLEVAKF